MITSEKLDYLESQLELILQDVQKTETDLQKLNREPGANLVTKVAERRVRKAGYKAKAALLVAREGKQS